MLPCYMKAVQSWFWMCKCQALLALSSLAAKKFGSVIWFQPEPSSQNQGCSCIEHTKQTVAGPFIISSIWIQWMMLSSYKGCARLILDVLGPLGSVDGQKVWQMRISAREPSSQNQGSLHWAHQENHCWTISSHPYGSNEWCYHPMKAVQGRFWICQALLMARWWPKSLADDGFSQQPESSQNRKAVCIEHTKQTTAGPFHIIYMDPMNDVTMLWRLCKADFGFVRPSWHCWWPKGIWQISARSKCLLDSW